jgi:cobyrinic acid a,c-diamide synthase
LRGFATHRPEVPLAGVICNRVGGARHAAILAAAVARHLPSLPFLGALPRDPLLALPERHLGLVQAGEHPKLDALVANAADAVEAAVDLERFLSLAQPGRAKGISGAPLLVPPLGQRIAVAQDVAFAFAYPATLAGWRAAGASLHPFSPLADEAPTSDCDAIYLPGGYPELHAGRLAGNARFISGLREAARRGAVIYGECGGYMVLGERLIDGAGRSYAMAGLLPLVTSFAAPRLHLGYRGGTLAATTPLGPAGASYRGHEFHYATVEVEGPGDPLFHLRDAEDAPRGPAGLVRGRIMGSFLHLVDRVEEEAAGADFARKARIEAAAHGA